MLCWMQTVVGEKIDLCVVFCFYIKHNTLGSSRIINMSKTLYLKLLFFKSKGIFGSLPSGRGGEKKGAFGFFGCILLFGGFFNLLIEVHVPL